MARAGVVLALLLAWAPSVRATPAPTRTRVVHGAPTPRAGGHLEAARGWLRAHPEDAGGVGAEELDAGRVVTMNGGATVRFAQRAGGLPVLDTAVVVRLDAEGRVRWTHGNAAPLGPVPAAPAVSAADAAALAAEAAGVPGVDPASAQLAVEPRDGAAALVWVIRAPLDPYRLRAPVVRVDAATGAVLRVEDRVWRVAQGSVWRDNPVKSPARTTESFPLLSGPDGLDDADFTVLNAIDRNACSAFPTSSRGIVNVHFVSLEAMATADPITSFLGYAPAGDADAGDPFAEVEMYYQLARGLAWFRALGIGNLATRPLLGVTNFLLPPQIQASECGVAGVPDTNFEPLLPFDNAAFVPRNEIFGAFPPTDALVFGQGTEVDFAYDGDVVLHELTHAVQVTVSELSGFVADDAGLDASPGALAEGFADYFSSAIQGDPEVGEYVGRIDPGGAPSGALRSLAADDACPSAIVGEAHLDSVMWSAGLWSERGHHDPAQFDAGALAVLSALGSSSRLTEARALLLVELAARFGPDDAAAAAARLVSRWGPDCERRIVTVGPGELRPAVLLTGTDVAPVGTVGVPGPLQLRVRLDAPAPGLRVAFTSSVPASGSGTPALKVLASGAPITWTWGSGGANPSPARRASFAVPAGGGASAVVVQGPFAAGDAYVQLANAGTSWVVLGLSVEAADASVIPTVVKKQTGGCGCGASGSPTALALLGLALALRRRGRPRGRS